MYCTETTNYRAPTQASLQASKNERVVKSVEPLSRHPKLASPTQRNTNASSTYASLSNVATKTENTSGLQVKSRDLQLTRSYTSTWRSTLRLFFVCSVFLNFFIYFFSNRNFSSFSGGWSGSNLRSTFSNIRRKLF